MYALFITCQRDLYEICSIAGWGRHYIRGRNVLRSSCAPHGMSFLPSSDGEEWGGGVKRVGDRLKTLHNWEMRGESHTIVCLRTIPSHNNVQLFTRCRYFFHTGCITLHLCLTSSEAKLPSLLIRISWRAWGEGRSDPRSAEGHCATSLCPWFLSRRMMYTNT